LHHHPGSAAYAVAAILRADCTHYGMDFINAMHHPFDDPQLFQTIDGLWIVQALSRREPACVDLLRNTELVVTSLRNYIASSTDAKTLVPALQALTNLGVPCGEVIRHVQQRAIIDAVPAAVACTSTEQWIPLFIDMLIEGKCSFPWKMEIMWALADFRVLLATSFWRDDLIDPLVELIKQHETTEGSIAIFDRALRFATAEEFTSRRSRFEAAGGVDLLEEKAAEGLRIAEQLVDDLFADDADDIHEDSVATFAPPPPSGRGRGMPIPAWMSNK
jgi:energy-converting hydrogenase A subunit M